MNKKRIRKVVILLTAICVISTIINISYQYLLPLYLSSKFNTDLTKANSIGIIGGADGPTAIYVSNSLSSPLISLILTLLSILGVVYLIYTKKNDVVK